MTHCAITFADLLSYSVYRRPSEQGESGRQRISTEVRRPWFTDTGLTIGYTYCYVVTARNAGGEESDHSNEACATPEPYPSFQEVITAVWEHDQYDRHKEKEQQMWDAAQGILGLPLPEQCWKQACFLGALDSARL